MTRTSANKPRGLILTLALWITRFFFLAAALCGAQAEQQNSVNAATFGYAVNEENGTVSVIAANNDTVVATVSVGAIPIQVATTPDGTHVYVTNNFSGTVSVIDTAKNSLVDTIPVGQFPVGVAIAPDGTRAYVTYGGNSGAVSVIDIARNKVVATIPVGKSPDGLAITPDSAKSDDRPHQPRAYVTNAGNNTVSVIDTVSDKVVTTIPVGQFPSGVAITPDASLAYVTNATDNTVSVIETASNTVVATIPVGQAPFEVAVTPEESDLYEPEDDYRHPLAYVTNEVDSTVSVIDTASNTVVATIPVGIGPVGVAITSDGTLAYVTSFFNSISVIDTATNTMTATIPVGPNPGGVAFATVSPSHR